MPIVTTAATVMQELGLLAFLILVGALSFGYLVWRIVKAQDKISATLDKVNERQFQHDQRAQDMHSTCKEHGGDIRSLKDEVNGVKTAVSGLTTEMMVLKEKVG